MNKRAAAKRRVIVDPVTQYAKDVTAKRPKIIAGPHVRAACERHLRDLKEGRKRGLVWKPKEALRVIDFFEAELVLTGGVPFKLQPWQKFIVGSLFGWYTDEGTRRFNTGYVETAKGNGKTPLAAGIGLVGLLLDNEEEAEIYSAAVSKDQARIVFDDAKRMVEESANLDEEIDEVLTNTINYGRSVFRPVSAEHKGLDGKRPHMSLVDELHEHATPMVLDKLRLGTKFRRNPLTLAITNAGFDRLSVCWREHEYGIKVASGAVQNDSHFAYVCALDEKDDYRDEAVWIKTSPNLGVSVHRRYIRQLLVESEDQPSKLNLILRLNFCVWTESHTVWVPDKVWTKNAGTAGPAQIAKVSRNRMAYIGLEISATTDFAAYAILFPDEEGEGEVAYDLLMRFWLCEEAFKRRVKLGREPYELWRSEGLINVTPGPATDYDEIERAILADCKTFDVREVVFDRHWASSLVAHLQDELSEDRVIEYGTTGAAMNAPVNEIERLAAREKLRHGGNPVMRWQIANVAITSSSGLKRINKDKSTESVVGPIALAMAMGRAMSRNAAPPDDEEDTTYDDQEVRTL